MLTTVILVIVVALVFDFTNGFHDTANAMATSVATGALKPRVAVLISAVLNLAEAVSHPEFAYRPETGEEIYQLLNEAQKKLLEDSNVQIDWKRVERIAKIQSRSWTTRAQPPFGKLSLELWEWPTGRVLEVSTKVAPDAGQSTYTELRDLAVKKGLVLSANQRSKTAMALGEITASQQK